MRAGGGRRDAHSRRREWSKYKYINHERTPDICPAQPMPTQVVVGERERERERSKELWEPQRDRQLPVGLTCCVLIAPDLATTGAGFRFPLARVNESRKRQHVESIRKAVGPATACATAACSGRGRISLHHADTSGASKAGAGRQMGF